MPADQPVHVQHRDQLGQDQHQHGRLEKPAAAALRGSRPALSSLLNGKANLSGEMALRIEKAFGIKMDTLMRMQSSYDIAQTRKRERRISVPRVSLLAATQ